jgi:hypothetical protein
VFVCVSVFRVSCSGNPDLKIQLSFGSGSNFTFSKLVVIALLTANRCISPLGVVESLLPWHILLKLLGLGLGLRLRGGGGFTGWGWGWGGGALVRVGILPRLFFGLTHTHSSLRRIPTCAVKILLPDCKTKVVGLPLLCGRNNGQNLQRGWESELGGLLFLYQRKFGK